MSHVLPKVGVSRAVTTCTAGLLHHSELPLTPEQKSEEKGRVGWVGGGGGGGENRKWVKVWFCDIN